MNVTKEGVKVRVGQKWRDLDKRESRVCEVIAVADGFATMRNGSLPPTRVRIDRMHKNSTGWQLVIDVEANGQLRLLS